MKRIFLSILALLLAPAWLLGTESGLKAVAIGAQRLTGGHLIVGGVEGRLLGDFVVRDLVYATGTVSVALDRAALNLRLSRLLVGRVQAETLDAGTLGVATREGRPPAEPRKPLNLRTPVRLAVEEGRLAQFRLRLAGRAEDWTVADVSFGAHWRAQWIVIGILEATTAEAGAVDLRGRIAIVDGRLELEDVEVAAPVGALQAKGALAIGDETESGLDVTWRDLRPPGEGEAAFRSAHGSARLEGPWRNYGWTLAAHVHGAGIAGDLDAHGRGDLRALTLQRGELKTLDGALSGSGRLQWAGGLATQLAVQWERLNPGSVWKEWPGRLNGKANLKAHWRDRVPHLEFDGALHDSQLRGYPFALQAVGRTEERKVFLKEFALQSGASRLRARGQLLPEMQLSGDLSSSDLRSLWAGLSGRADLKATASGTFASPRLAANGTVDDLVYQRYRITHGTVDADLSLAGRSRFEIKLTDLQLGIPLAALNLSGSGTRGQHRLRVAAQGREGAAAIALDGGERDGAWRGRLVEAKVTPPRSEVWALEEPAPLAFARGRLETQPICLAAGGSRACAQLGLGAGRQRIAFRTRDFDLKHVRPWLPGEWNLAGTITGNAALTIAGGELAEIRADLDASEGSVEGGGVRMEFGPGQLRVEPEDDKLHARIHLRPAGGEIDGEVWIAAGGTLLDRAMLGDLKLRMPDLAWLPVLSPEIASAQGALDADLHVSGTLRGPSLDGKVHLTGGRVSLTTPGIELTDLTASFERGRDAPLLLHAQAKSGDGEIRVDGEIKTLQPKLAGEITIKGDQVLGFNRSDIRAWLSPDLKLALDGRTARLTGELGVPRAEITPREIDQSGVAPSGDQIIVEADEAQAHGRAMLVETEVKIVLGDNVRFDGLGLKTRLTGAITAYDDPARPTRGRGELRLDGGRYKAYGTDLQIETGRLIFSGGPITDPAIDLSAVRKPREDIKVGLRARGTLDKPEFSLFSDPAMSQEEQLSWLVLGRSLSGSLDSGQRSQLNSAAMSLGLTGGDYIAQRLAPRLGLDEVSIAAKPGETADLARFTIGKYLSPKLFVSYGVGLFQPGHFFRMQYDLGKRFKLVGESGVQQGGDVLYSIER